MYNSSEADALFKRLDLELMENIDSQYFSDTRDFRSLNEVLEVLGQKVDQINKTAGDASKDLLTVLKDRNPAYSKLLNQRKIVEEVIEDVVKFQHGGLNHSVDTMSEVVREYTRGRDDIQGLRKSLFETQAVLTAKKNGQIPLKELWQKKVELQETLRMVRDLESLKSAPHRVQRLMQQKRYLTAVNTLNKAITIMFGEDLVGVRGLSALREQLMDMKESMLETCVAELKSAVVAAGTEQLMKDYNSGSDSEGEGEEGATNDNRSDSARSYISHINDEVRTIVSQSHAGGGGRHELSSAHSHAGGGGGGGGGLASQRGGLANAQDAWPVDLRDLDESLESSLTDPSTAGSLYIRLLVKTVGVLECEEDVERMVLDGVVERFKESAIRNVRENAAAKLSKELARPSRERGEDDDDLTVHTRLFTSFIGSLLDSSLLALRRMLYLLKLLYVSKSMRSEGAGFSAALSAAHIDVEKHFKDHDKRQVLSVYMGLEDQIVQQMLSHLVEPDVQDIMDSGTGRMENLVSKHGSMNREGFMLLEKGEDYQQDGEVELIFAPSARHAAPIFRRIVMYSHLINKVFKENGLEDMRMSLLAARLAPPTPNHRTEGTGDTSGRSLLDVIQTFLENELIPVIQSTVNAGMREIQLNNAHFSVTLNSINGAAVGGGGGGNGNSGEGGGGGANRRGGADTVPLCHAAHLCCTSSKPLFSYWLQLHQHRSMVCTVLDRLIRGYASAAREELEALTYHCVTATQENMHSSLVQSTKLDPLYKAYRMKVFGINKVSVDDLFSTGATSLQAAEGGKALARRSFMPNSSASCAAAGGGVSSMRRSSLRGSGGHSHFGGGMAGGGGLDGADLDEQRGRNALEVAVWDQLDYWDVGNTNYPITAQKIVTDFAAVGTIASIAYGCDWLIKKLSGFSGIAARKITASAQMGPGNASPGISPSPSSTLVRKQLSSGTVGSGVTTVAGGGGAQSRPSVTLSMSKQSQKAELLEHRNQLITTVVAGARELSRIAEEGMALLRGELQLICFYFLHRLSHIVYAPPAAMLDMSSASHGSGHSGGHGGGSRSSNARMSFGGSPQALQRPASPANQEGIAEEEAILGAFNEHLQQYLRAVASSTSPDALAALLSPLCSVIPRILTHCAMHMVSEIDKANSDDDEDFFYSASASADHYLKTHLLRMVVSVQQSFALHLQSYAIQLETRRRLTDLLTDGFERSRRFITMFGMPSAELKAYLKSNANDYSKEEVEILWMKAFDKDITFVQLWKELETIPRTGPKASVALQFAH